MQDTLSATKMMIVQFHFNLEPCSRPARNLLSEKILCKSAGCLNREFSTEDHRVEQSINSLNFVFNMRRNWGGSQGRGRLSSGSVRSLGRLLGEGPHSLVACRGTELLRGQRGLYNGLSD